MAEQMPSRDADVDARFLLANERTLLAWVRTALTLLAAGVGVEQFASEVPGRTGMAVALTLTGALAALAGAVRYRRADFLLRRNEVPSTGVAAYLLAGVVALVGVVVAAAIVAR